MSNQASAHSSVAVTTRHTISSCLPFQAVHAIAANPSSSATSNPIQAARHPEARYVAGSVTARMPIQTHRNRQHPTATARAMFRRTLAFGSWNSGGRSRAASMRATR